MAILTFKGQVTDFNRQEVNIDDTKGIVVFRANRWKRFVPASNQGLYVPAWNNDEEHYLPVNDDYIAEWYVRPWLLYVHDKVNKTYKIDERQEGLLLQVLNLARYNNYTSSSSWVVTPFSFGQPQPLHGYQIDKYPIKEVNAPEPKYDLTILGDYYTKSTYDLTYQEQRFIISMISGNSAYFAFTNSVDKYWTLMNANYAYSVSLIEQTGIFGAYTLQPPNTSFFISKYSNGSINGNGLLEIFMTVSDKRVIESANK